MTTTKRKESKAKPQRQRGRPAREYPTIDAPFESVVKALVQPVKEKQTSPGEARVRVTE